MRRAEPSVEAIHISTFRHGRWLIGLAATDRGLARIAFPARDTRSFRAEIEERFPGERIVESTGAAKGPRVLAEARRQITEYLSGRLRRFTVKLDLGRVTPFRRRVLEATRAIPYGETASYREIASRIGSPRAARAVGGAQNRNPLPLVIPCHRVIGADGSLVGFGGGLKLKSFLLDLERESRVQ
jgi:O-6-methylguanine DNA methyltransferase